MWKLFAKMGFEYLEDYLLEKIQVVQHFQATLELVLTMGGQVLGAVTDKNPDNKAQLQQIWENNFVNLLSVVLRGVYDVVKNQHLKERVIAILRKTLNEIDPPTASA